MKFEYKITSNNITYNPGDTLLIDFSQAFFYVKSIDNIDLDFTPIEAWNEGHDVYIRWTYDVIQLDRATGKPHTVWSAWEQFTKDGAKVENVEDLYRKIIRNKSDSFDVQFKVVRRGTTSGARSVDKLLIEYTPGKVPENVATPVISQNGCKVNVCPTTNFSSGITIQCDTNLFRPYDVIAPAIKIYHEMACSVSEMFGHCVRYFKTQAKLESADPILKEYSLYEVTDVKDIKILIPDNQFPDNAIKFLPYDMDFGEGIECHIVREHFERAFGQSDLPEQKDYIYFPLIDRIFEVQSAYLYRDFMATEAYYKVMLYKWQDKLNVMRTNPEIDKYVNDLHISLDEVLAPEIQKEYVEVTKPMQYQTIAIGGFDSVRSHINENLVIETKDLTNYFTIVGKYFYNMPKGMKWNDIAVKYKLEVNRGATANTAFTMWFKPQRALKEAYDVLIDGYNQDEQKGFQINLNYNSVTGNTKSITVISNSQVRTFDVNFPALSPNDWYALTVNHMNEFGQISVHIWKMKYNSALPPMGQQKTTDLQLAFTQVADINPEAIDPTSTIFQLRAGGTLMTNIRIWRESMEEEKQPISLNQFVVRDQDVALLIDNAIPPLRMVREYVR